MITPMSPSSGGTPTGSAPLALRAGEDLVVVRAGEWRVLVPMRYVERVCGAALPAAVPSEEGAPRPPVISVAGDLLPVVFAEGLLGADEAVLEPEDKMVLLRHAGRRALLWVSAAEEIVEFEPVAQGPPPGGVLAGFSGADEALAVLDVPRVLDLATEGSRPQGGSE